MSVLAEYDRANPMPVQQAGEPELAFNKRWNEWTGKRNQAWGDSEEATKANAAKDEYRKQCQIRMSAAFKPDTGVIYDDERMNNNIRKMTGNSKWMHPMYEQQN